MGFFSKLKKFWKSEEAPAATTAAPVETPAEAAPEAVADAPGRESLAAATAPSLAPADEPEAAQSGLAVAPAIPAAGESVSPTPARSEPAMAPRPAQQAAPPAAAPGKPTVFPAAPAPAQTAPAAAPTAGSPAVAQATGSPVTAAPADSPVVTERADAPVVAAPTAGSPVAPEPAAAAPGRDTPPPPAATPPAKPAPAAAATAAPDETAPWRNALILELRQAEPKLSAWLDILLAGVETAGPDLWERLRFLFTSLEAPAAEADAFVTKFADWIAVMEYDEVELFRSELQYRLALALDLEDEEDERNRLFLKLSEGLAKTKEQIVKRIDGLLGHHKVIDEAFWEELEEILLIADVGFEPAAKLMSGLRDKVRKRGVTDPAAFKDILREELSEIFRATKTIKAINPPEVVMMIGVNGVGKTTTIAKLAHRDIMRGKKVLIAAGDTFRAAAIEQLQIWAKRVGADFYSKGEGADPAAVAFEAMDKVLSGGYDVLYLDTAGRLHTKTNLMEELKKINRVVGKKHPGAPHRSVLVLDATTGQNALSQTKLFNEAAGVDEIILTKLDGTAKGGVVVGIALSFGVPITYVGLGEKMEDLRPFVGQDFAQALLGVS